MSARPFVLAMLLVLCMPVVDSQIAVGAQEPFVIPTITSMTGSGAFIGQEAKETLDRLETAINLQGGIKGRPIHFEIYDDQSSPQVAVQLFNGIVAKGNQLVIGPSLTNSCLAVAPFVTTKIVEFCLSPGLDPPKASFTFAPSVSGPDIFSTLIHFFHKRGWNRVATLTTSDATGQQADQRVGGAIALPENKGVQVVAQEHFAPADLTIAAQVSRLKAAKQQVVIAWAIGSPFATALRNMSDAGFDVPLLASNSNMIYDQMKKWSEIMPSQLLFSGPAFLGGRTARVQNAAVDQFFSVTKDVGVTPDFALAIALDPALILVSSLRKLGTNATASQITSTLKASADSRVSWGSTISPPVISAD
jgi:branched-chain amino acid transport system substrate-binding protein